MTTTVQTTTSTADTSTASTSSSTAKPKGDRWQHKELEAVLKNPAITRVTEAGGLYVLSDAPRTAHHPRFSGGGSVTLASCATSQPERGPATA